MSNPHTPLAFSSLIFTIAHILSNRLKLFVFNQTGAIEDNDAKGIPIRKSILLLLTIGWIGSSVIVKI